MEINNKAITKKTGQSFAMGAFIMAIGMVIVKIAGAAFKIPLAYILGEVGQGYFGLAYSLYNPLYALATAGLPIAISRMVSKEMTNHRYRDVKEIHKISIPIFLTTGVLGTIFMLLGAGLCVNFTKTPGVLYSIIALAPTVLFSCLISIYKGYYEGLRNMIPTAVSEVVEAIGKIIFGLGFSAAAVECGMNEYYKYGTVFGKYCESEAVAHSATLPFASAGAVLGITLGAISGFIYIFIKYKISGDGITYQDIKNSEPAHSKKIIVKSLLSIAIPIALGAIVMNLAGMIDTMLIQRRLSDIMKTAPQALLGVYEGLIPVNVVQEGKTHNFLAGCFAYMSTVTMLLPTITQGLAISALPNVTSSWIKGIKENIKSNIETVLKMTSIIAFPAGMGMCVLSYPLMDLIYNTFGKSTKAAGVSISAQIMVIYAIATIFVAISTPICSMLQAVGRADLPLKILTIGMILKIVFNYILVGVPQINIQGAGIGTLICYVFVCVSGIIMLKKYAGVNFDFGKIFFKPFICSLACGIAAYVSQELLAIFMNSKIATLISIVIACFVYIAFLLLLRAVTAEDLGTMPKSKKIIKTLEKWHLIG